MCAAVLSATGVVVSPARAGVLLRAVRVLGVSTVTVHSPLLPVAALHSRMLDTGVHSGNTSIV